MIEFISQPWHWAVSGLAIAGIMFMLLWFGGEFGVSSNLRTLCAIGGAGRRISFFKYNWQGQIWNLVFVGGAVIGGFIAITYLQSPQPVAISEATQDYLNNVGIQTPSDISEGLGYVPSELFHFSNSNVIGNLIFLILGGFLVGFGTRYAGGCTSGHAISGLANFQIPSLIAVIGFFIGGLLMTWLILPALLTILNS